MKRVFSLVDRWNSYGFSVNILLLVSLLIFHGCTAETSHQSKVPVGDTPVTSHPGNGNKHDIKKSNNGHPGKLECAEDDKACEKDRLGLEAIKTLHLLIDDDHNGNVDQSESDEFLRDELQYTDGFERQALFHNNDKLISVDDLWRAWKYSVVYNWTTDDVIEWLVEDVDLPQYSHAFHNRGMDGSFLPRLINASSSMLVMLGIRNPVHKKKLSLKAMDTVLFGAPKRVHSYIKDVILVSSLIITFGGAWFTYLQHRYSKTQYKKMLNDLESLQKAEEALKKLSLELSDAEKNQKSIPAEKQEELMLLRKSSVRLKVPNVPRVTGDMSPTSLSRESSLVLRKEGERKLRQAEEDISNLREALYEAENKLELQQHLESQWSVPGELQAWLQLTHELEVQHYNAKHQAAERQLFAARDGCDKIKKRNKAFFGSLRMAHSNSMDEIDQSLLDARAALEEVKQDLQERLHRWHTMEMLCAFPIITNPGLSNLRQVLGRDPPNGNAGRNIPGNVLAPLSIDEADEDLPPVGYTTLPTGHSKSYLMQTMTGSTGSLSHAGKSPSTGQCQSSMATIGRRESHESVVLQAHAHGAQAQANSVLFHLGEGSTANHERSHSNASSIHHSSSVSNGHSAHHPYPHHHSSQYAHQAVGHTHPRPLLGAYNQSHSYPPVRQSNIQTPTSHLSANSSFGTLSKAASSYVSLRSSGLSASNSNLAMANQKVYANHEDHSADGHAVVQNSPLRPDSLPLSSVSQRSSAVANESWEMESTDSLHHQSSLSSDRPQLLRSPEFEETTSTDTASLQSASALAVKDFDKKASKKKKYLPNFLRKNSSKQKMS